MRWSGWRKSYRRSSDDAHVRRIFRLHADNVIARIDMMNFAGDPRAQIREEVERCVAHFLNADRAFQR